MDNQHARFILQSCRAGNADASDPQFTEALQLAERDSELAAWLEEEQAVDAAIARKLKEVPVPDDLGEFILSGQETSAPAPPVRRAATLLALAALLVLLATLAALWLRPAHSAVNLAAFRGEMLANVSGPLRLTFRSTNIVGLTQWLADQGNVSGVNIPAALQGKPGIGCRSWTWNGKPVGLICILLDDGKEAVHLFVVDRSAVPDAPADRQPSFEQNRGWTTAAWSDGNKLYVLAGRGDRANLEKLL